MAWLRIDDGFTEHRKLVELTRSDRWTWVEILCYCARQQNGGTVPSGIGDIIRRATPKYLARCVDLGLIDRHDGTMTVHDWDIYNAATIEERVAAYVQNYPNATANEVHRAIGGKRALVLAAVAKLRENTGTQPVPQPGTHVVPNPVPEPVPLAGARAAPAPSPTPKSKERKGPSHNSLRPEPEPEQHSDGADADADIETIGSEVQSALKALAHLIPEDNG